MITLNDFEIFKDNTDVYYHSSIDRNVNNNAYLSIVATNDCQLKCSYCINSHTDRSLELPLEKALKNIKSLVLEFGIEECVILGGEPTLYSNIVPLIQGLNKIGFEKICLTTNGVLINDSIMDQIILSGITHLNISMHSKNPKIIDAIHVLKHNYSKLKIRINSNIYKYNHDTFESLLDWIEYLQTTECDSIRISNIIDKDSFSVNNLNSNLSLKRSDEYYSELFKLIIEKYSKSVSCIHNPNTLGFVDYVMIPLRVPVILNRNINSKVSEQATTNTSTIHTFKCLVSGDISLSWNSGNIITLTKKLY